MMRAAKTTSKRLPEETVRFRAYDEARPAFTLIELLVVIGIIVLLATMMFPAIKSLTKSNDQSQAVNLVRSMLGTARSIAISQHREAGVVFFEEHNTYSNPVNGGQTAMQLFVEDFNQNGYIGTGYVLYSPARQYLPSGVRVAALATDTSAGKDANGNNENVQAGDANPPSPRAIIFDANGQLVVKNVLCVPNPNSSSAPSQPGIYPFAYGDWNFFINNPSGPPAGITYSSSPGFFLYSKAEYDAFTGDRAAWIQQHADVVIVNSNTGAVFQ